MSLRPCTCQWSLVNTTTEDAPHIISIDPNCPRHGGEYNAEDDFARLIEEAR
jgi:hypothetical protein